MKFKVIVPLVILISVIIIWRLNIFAIDKVKTSNFAQCISQNELDSEINAIDKNSILIDSKKFRNNLMKKYPCIKDISVIYEFPKTVSVTVYGRNFFAKVYSADFLVNLPDLESSVSSETALIDWSFPEESSGDALGADETGFIFGAVAQSSLLPKIFLNTEIDFGTQLDPGMFKSIEQIFSKIITIEPFTYQTNFRAKNYGNVLLIDTSPKLAFSVNHDNLRQLASLQLILQKAKINERVLEFIDLRFDKPVVQYRTNSSK